MTRLVEEAGEEEEGEAGEEERAARNAPVTPRMRAVIAMFSACERLTLYTWKRLVFRPLLISRYFFISV